MSFSKLEFSQECFDKVKDIIFDLSGIYLTNTKREMVYSRLTRVVNKNKLRSIDELVDKTINGSTKEKQAFINILTTNKTSFYRESYHFEILETFLTNNFSERQDAKVWCAASSTGEEPYTISMSFHRAFNTYDHKSTILATDIDTNVLFQSTKGIYSQYDVDNALTHDIAEYFEDTDLVGKKKIIKELKQPLTFKRYNLTKKFPDNAKFDVIFCRNVMIYFNQETQRRILETFKNHLNPGGLLFAGHSENFTYFASDLFRPIGKTTYCHAENTADISDIIGGGSS